MAREMRRTDVINALIRARGYTRYLEIGVADGDCFLAVKVPYKAGVDPVGPAANYRMDSDTFFARMDEAERLSGVHIEYDIVFVDGAHLEAQVDRDIANSLKHLAPGGVIVVHDCNPPTERHASPRGPKIRSATGRWLWCGTVWRSWVKLRCTREDLSMRVVDCDWGCGVIERGPQVPYRFAPVGRCLDWTHFSARRLALLNLVSFAEFMRELEAK